MPTYDYKCSSCGNKFEFFQPMSATPLIECPQCKGLLKRIIGTGAGPIFKGSGFYQTDYKNKSSQINKSDISSNQPKVDEKKSEKDDKKL